MDDEKLGFVELAVLAMEMVNRPITPTELWEFVLQNKLHFQLKTFDEKTQTFSGKTPSATFNARIRTDKEHFVEIPNTKPKQYILKHQFNHASKQPVSRTHTKKSTFHERYLHQFWHIF